MRTIWNLCVLGVAVALIPLALLVAAGAVALGPLYFVAGLFGGGGSKRSYRLPRRTSGTRQYVVMRNGRTSTFHVHRS